MVVSSQMTFQNYLNAMDQAIERRDLLDRQIADLVREWSLGPVVEASVEEILASLGRRFVSALLCGCFVIAGLAIMHELGL
jgi:hypothetical protein